MLGIGILSLLSVGFVAMAMGGGDDVDDVDTSGDDMSDIEQTGQDMLSLPEEDAEPFDLGFVPNEDADPEDVERINAFLAELQEDPGEDPVQSFQDFIADLEAERAERLEASDPLAEEDDEDDVADDGDAVDQPVAEEEDEAPARPPTGEGFRDPLLLAGEPQIPRDDGDEFDAPAGSPEDLVTVTSSDGSEVADALVLAEAEDDGSEMSRDFVVTAPDAPHDIDVGYNADSSFEIQYNDETGSITAGLNSTIVGPEGTVEQSTLVTRDDDGNLVPAEVLTNSFDSSSDITLEVTAEQLGVHVAQIDLVNPADTLEFNFDDDVLGNFHLVFFNAEDPADGDTGSTFQAFVVQTASDQASLSLEEINDFARNGEMRSATTNVVAQISLGNDVLQLGDPGAGAPDIVLDFINEDPTILSSIEWASIANIDEDELPQNGGGTSDPDTFANPDFNLDVPFNIPIL